MLSLYWFLLGAGTCALATWLVRSARSHTQTKAAIPPRPAGCVAPAPSGEPCANGELRCDTDGIVDHTPTSHLEAVAESVSAELASLASGIEGNAQLLCEAIGSPELVPPRAEQLWGAVRRLRALSEKIQFAIGSNVLRRGSLAVEDVLASVQHELDDWSYGRFQVAVDVAQSLPEVCANANALRRALLYLVEVLFAKEPSAGKLTMRAAINIAEDAQTVVLHIAVEVEETLSAQAPHPAQIELAEAAARNLLAALDAEWTLEHIPGMEVSAWIALPVATEDSEEPAGPSPSGDSHEFGGVLILESDPAVRFMVGQELERTGRQVLLCADGTAARALWRATPERFELLIVDPRGRREMGDQLAADALTTKGVRIILLGVSDHPALAAAVSGPQPRVVIVPKPFGLMELRDALAQLGVPSEAVAR